MGAGLRNSKRALDDPADQLLKDRKSQQPVPRHVDAATLRPKPSLGFQPPGPGPLLLNGHGEKNKQGSPNRTVRATLKGEATGRVLCATFETIFRSVLI